MVSKNRKKKGYFSVTCFHNFFYVHLEQPSLNEMVVKVPVCISLFLSNIPLPIHDSQTFCDKKFIINYIFAVNDDAKFKIPF